MTLFTTMFTASIVLCSLKSMCVPSFILIGCCVSELHGYLCAHCKRLFIVVLQELHCLCAHCKRLFIVVLQELHCL